MKQEEKNELEDRANKFFEENPNLIADFNSKAINEDEVFEEDEEDEEDEDDETVQGSEDADKKKKLAKEAQKGAEGKGDEKILTLSDLTKNRWKTVEDIDREIESRVREREEQLKKEFESTRYVSSLSKRIDELASNGIEVTPEILVKATKDYSTIDVTNPTESIALIREQLKLKEPGITDREIDYHIKSEFGTVLNPLPNEDDENYKSLIERRESELLKLTRSGRLAKQELVENQSKLAIPAKSENLMVQRSAEEIEKVRQQIRDVQRKSLETFDRVAMEIDGETIEYVPNDTEKEGIVELAANGDRFITRYIKEDGSVDREKMNEEFLFLENRHKIVTSMAKKLASRKLEAVLNKIKNRTTGKPTSARNADESVQERAERILGLNY